MLRLAQRGKQGWTAPQNLGLNYVGTPALSLDEKEQVIVAVQKNPGGAVVMLDQGQEQEVARQSASQPTLYRLNGILYLASRPVGLPTRDNWSFTTEPVAEPERTRARYLELAAKDDTILVIDASQTPDRVKAAIEAALADNLKDESPCIPG